MTQPFGEHEKYIIRSDLLYELLTYGDNQPNKLLDIGSNWSCGPEIWAAKGVLTWLCEQAFNVRRLPWRPDTVFAEGCLTDKGVVTRLNARLQTIVNEQPQVIEEAIVELRELQTAHMQWLVTSNPKLIERVDGEDYLKLGRAYMDQSTSHRAYRTYHGYATRLLELQHATNYLRAAEVPVPDSISVPHDLLTSWTCEAFYPKRSVNVNTLVPVKDILCSSNFLGVRGVRGYTGHIPALERGEWVVMTANVFGTRQIPVNDISLARGTAPPDLSGVSSVESCQAALEQGFQLENEFERLKTANLPRKRVLRSDGISRRFMPAMRMLFNLKD